MKQSVQNIAVGITVIVAFLILAGLILMFTGLPQLFERGYEIRMLFDRTGDSKAGDIVYLAGIKVGRVTDISFTDPNDMTKGVTFTARIDRSVRLPSNIKAELFSRIGGSPYLQLSADGPLRKDPKTGQVIQYLPADRAFTIKGEHCASSIIPQEVNDLAKSLAAMASKLDKVLDDLAPAMKGFGKLVDNLNSLLGEEQTALPAAGGSPGATTEPAEKPAAPSRRLEIKETLAKLGKVIEGLNTIFGDPENQKNLKTALASFSEASGQATEALQSLKALSASGDDLIQKLIQGAEMLSRILTSVEKAVMNIEQGKGNLGKFLNDNELYNNLVTASKTLAKTLEELQSLLQEWKASGVRIKLK